MLDKELRVLGRQGRTYWVRSGYVLLLLVMFVGLWISLSLRRPMATWNHSVTTQIARSMIDQLVWLQFVVAHILVMVTLGNSLSTEVRTRGLAVLLSSPLRSWQIVLGKWLGGLLLPWGLILVSLPVLAAIRVWGGIPWDYLGLSAVVLIGATAWIGALSLWTSLWLKQPHHVVIAVLLMTLSAYGAADLILRWAMGQGQFSDWWLVWCPYGMQRLLELNFHRPGAVSGSLPWFRYSAIVLGAAGLVLSTTAWCLRRRSVGRLLNLTRSRRTASTTATIKRAPVLWRELQGRSMGRALLRQVPCLVLVTGPMVTLAWISARSNIRAYVVEVYQAAMMVLWLAVTLRLALDAVVSITREIQGRGWPVLLATPLSGPAILGQKAWAVIWRNLAGALALMLPPVCYLVVMGTWMHDPGFFIKAALWLALTGTTLGWLVAAGMFWSLRLRVEAAAVEATLASALAFHTLFEYLVHPLAQAWFGSQRASLFGARMLGLVLYGTVGAILWVVNLRHLHRYRCDVAEV